MTRLLRRALPRLIAVALAAACGGGDGGPTLPAIRTPTSIVLVGGNNQSGVVATTLSEPISVRVSDAHGPIPDIAVIFTIVEGGGNAVPPNRRTDASGVAATGWRLGPTANQANLIRASVDGLEATVTFNASAIAGAATRVLALEGVAQFAVVNTAVPTPPRVQVGDAFANPVPGVPVTFSIVAGDGTISGAEGVSDAEGMVQVGSWTLGPAPGANTLRATIGSGAFAEISATGTAADLVITAGNGQSSNAGTLVPIAPTVRAVDGNMVPLPGVPVTFSVIDGGGSVVGAVAVTNAAGLATPTGWVLGGTPGTNRLTATAPGTTAVTFTATAIASQAAALIVTTPGPLQAFLGNFLGSRPRVRVVDGQGAPVAGVPVVFDVVDGGGQVFGPVTISDPSGHAEAMAWRLGHGGASQTLRATAPNLPAAMLNATAVAPPAGEFNIELRYVGQEPTPAQRAAFDAAVARWQLAIVGDLPLEPGPIPATGSLCGTVEEDVDDVVIFVRLETIDGPGGVLGSAGPCWIRGNSDLTIVGGMRFDLADLANLENTGSLESVILHEMGHVLGIGTLWQLKGLLIGPATSASPGDPHFVGPAALGIFPTVFTPGTGYAGLPVPVENVGGPGTFNGHWRENVLRNELMTGFINSGANPLSPLTLGSLRDLGYLVDDSAADFFELAPALMAAPPIGPLIALPPISSEPIRRRPRR